PLRRRHPRHHRAPSHRRGPAGLPRPRARPVCSGPSYRSRRGAGMSEPASGPPASLAGLAIHLLFRGDRTQLLEWCNFHLTAAADRLYVVLDCPSSELVDSLPVDPRIDWQVMDQAAWDAVYPASSSNFERKLHDAFRWTARRAAQEGRRHLAFIDADEL